jgi:hypothetical protein
MICLFYSLPFVDLNALSQDGAAASAASRFEEYAPESQGAALSSCLPEGEKVAEGVTSVHTRISAASR